MSLPVVAEPLPTSYTFGKVVGRVIQLIADTAEDTDDKPQARAAIGRVSFAPKEVLRKTAEADYPAIVLHSTQTANLSSTGRILDAEGRQGIWLAAGIYRVSFEITGASATIPAFDIQVTAEHTDAAPLDLAKEAPYVAPAGTTVQTVLIPSGGTTGQVLVRSASGGLEWANQTGGSGGTGTISDGSITPAKLSFDPATQAELDAANTANRARANHTGTQSLDTTTDSATRLAMTAAERTKLGGVATSATANSTDAQLRDRSTHTGTQSADTLTDGSTNRLYSSAEKTKLGGVATGATANSTDAQLRDRSAHTGTQTSASITDFAEAVQDAVGALLGAGSNVILNYDDAANTLTVSATGAGGTGLDAEQVRDAIGVALIGVGNIAVTVNDAADTITITTTATANSTDAQLRDRSTHTGTQAASTVTGLATVATSGAYGDLSGRPTIPAAYTDEQAQDAAAAALAAGTHTGITFTYDDAGNRISAAVTGGGGGGAGLPATIVARTTAYTAAAGDFVLADATSAGFTVTLPAAPAAGALVTVKKTDATANVVTVVGQGGKTIDGDANATIVSKGAGAVFEYDGTNWRITAVTSAQGTKGDTGAAGAKGDTGTTGPKGDPGVGVPPGGTTGQVLAKTSGTDYATTWTTPAAGGGGGGSNTFSDIPSRGRMYMPVWMGGSIGESAITAGESYGLPIYLPAGTITRLAVPSGGANVTGTARFAVFTMNRDNPANSTLLVDAGNADMFNGGANRSVTLSQPITEGWYIIALFNAQTRNLRSVQNGYGQAGIAFSVGSAITPGYGWKGAAGLSGSFGATFGGATELINVIPMILVEMGA